jgi:GT2 family glycosyltransferase
MNVTIILLAFNGAMDLPQCLSALTPLPEQYQLLVIDNGSDDNSADIARSMKGNVVVIENDRNYGFSGGMNIGMRLVMGTSTAKDIEDGKIQSADVIILLNQDTQCLPGWHAAITAPFADPTIGAVGCKIIATDKKTILHVGGCIEEIRGTSKHFGQGEEDNSQYDHMLIPVQFATGAALALRTSVLKQVGLFDERYHPAYVEEVDLCYRIWRAGYKVIVNTAAQVLHHEHTSTREFVQRSHWFNRHRLLFMIKTRPLSFLLNEFAEAERAYFRISAGHEDNRALQRAYMDAIIHLSDWCAAREEFMQVSMSQSECDQLRQLLITLRDDCVRSDAKVLASPV